MVLIRSGILVPNQNIVRGMALTEQNGARLTSDIAAIGTAPGSCFLIAPTCTIRKTPDRLQTFHFFGDARGIVHATQVGQPTCLLAYGKLELAYAMRCNLRPESYARSCFRSKINLALKSIRLNNSLYAIINGQMRWLPSALATGRTLRKRLLTRRRIGGPDQRLINIHRVPSPPPRDRGRRDARTDAARSPAERPRSSPGSGCVTVRSRRRCKPVRPLNARKTSARPSTGGRASASQERPPLSPGDLKQEYCNCPGRRPGQTI